MILIVVRSLLFLTNLSIILRTVDDYRVYLTTPVVGRNDYINAVFLSVSLAESFANTGILKHIKHSYM